MRSLRTLLVAALATSVLTGTSPGALPVIQPAGDGWVLERSGFPRRPLHGRRGRGTMSEADSPDADPGLLHHIMLSSKSAPIMECRPGSPARAAPTQFRASSVQHRRNAVVLPIGRSAMARLCPEGEPP